MKGSLRMIKRMVRDIKNGKTAENIVVNGKLGNKMELDFTEKISRLKSRKVNGLKEKELNGLRSE